MKDGFNYDGVVKDLLEEDRPALLGELSGGIPVTEFLNVEITKVLDRRLDLVMRLADGSILHVELQSKNDRYIAYLEGVYCFLLGRKYPGRLIRQVVLYLGRDKLRMPSGIDFGETRNSFRLLDIRDIAADHLLASGNPADIAMAVLAGGGKARLPEIIRRLAVLKGPERARALAQLLVLSGLRGLPARVEWELRHMGVLIDVKENPVLLRWEREASQRGREAGLAEGRAEGRTKGRVEGQSILLLELLRAKFGPVPKWAGKRVAEATPAQLTLWARKVLTASTLEGVIGKPRK